ncbi:MAG: DNA (cytosine-5-)-methyltransferase [Bacteroidaceae bacterium]|nr:DNA (cytosine-5-)-methyltransferase [Bacteroidaceae bacterium]
MATVEKDINESLEKIDEVKRIVKSRTMSLEDQGRIQQTPLCNEFSWKEKQFSQPQNTVRIGTVFSGIRAIEHAFQRLGLKHKIIFAGDIDAKCKQSYFANYQIEEKDWFSDVRDFNASKYRDCVDFVVGGAPCQAFSMVGHRLGFEDARGTLFYEFARVIKETQPKIFLFENVRGLLNHDKGRTWHVMYDIFKELGYYLMQNCIALIYSKIS